MVFPVIKLNQKICAGYASGDPTISVCSCLCCAQMLHTVVTNNLKGSITDLNNFCIDYKHNMVGECSHVNLNFDLKILKLFEFIR